MSKKPPNPTQLPTPDSLDPPRGQQLLTERPRPPVPDRPVWLYGFGGHAKVVADLLLSCKLEMAGIVDDNQEFVTQSDLGVRPGLKLDPDSEIFAADQPMVVCVGSNRVRSELAVQLPNRFVSLYHPTAVISPTANTGNGTV